MHPRKIRFTIVMRTFTPMPLIMMMFIDGVALEKLSLFPINGPKRGKPLVRGFRRDYYSDVVFHNIYITRRYDQTDSRSPYQRTSFMTKRLCFTVRFLPPCEAQRCEVKDK